MRHHGAVRLAVAVVALTASVSLTPATAEAYLGSPFPHAYFPEHEVNTYRPRNIYDGFGAHEGIQAIRWHTWDGATASGIGTWYGYAGYATESNVRVHVTLANRTACPSQTVRGGRIVRTVMYMYLRLSISPVRVSDEARFGGYMRRDGHTYRCINV